MSSKLGCIHALDRGDAGAEIAAVGNKHGVFELVSAFTQDIEEEMSGYVFG